MGLLHFLSNFDFSSCISKIAKWWWQWTWITHQVCRDLKRTHFPRHVILLHGSLTHRHFHVLPMISSKGLVEQHGGTLTAISDGIGLGSTFSIELPVFCKCNNDLVGVSAKHDVEEQVPCNNGLMSDASNADLGESLQNHHQEEKKNRKVLVVEDVDTNRKLLVRLLERAGHTTASAVNGQEAVDMYLADKELTKENDGHIFYDTILMDYEMPM